MKNKYVSSFAIIMVAAMWSGASVASTNAYPLSNINFTQQQESLQRGANIYYKVCRMCHSMKYIRYKNFLELGLSKEYVDSLRGTRQMGETLSKTVSDAVLVAYYGQVPPDLSVMAKARKHGPQYIYTLMASYSKIDGSYDNLLFPGIRMPDVMNISTSIDEAHKAKISDDIKDVTEYLLWASDPRAAERKTTGIYVIAYFILLSAMLFLIMKRVWSRLDK